MRFVSKRLILVGIGLLFCGLLIGVLAAHLWDSEQMWLNRRAVGTMVLASQNLFDIDSKMLNADSTTYQALLTCLAKPKECNPQQSEKDIAKSNGIYNSLIKPREEAVTRLDIFYKEFQAVNP